MTTASSRGNSDSPTVGHWTQNSQSDVFFFFTSVFCLYACCSAQKESTKKANMKRENKAYSYKEQIIELELQEVKLSVHY